MLQNEPETMNLNEKTGDRLPGVSIPMHVWLFEYGLRAHKQRSYIGIVHSNTENSVATVFLAVSCRLKGLEGGSKEKMRQALLAVRIA